jgi:hypothetical protein
MNTTEISIILGLAISCLLFIRWALKEIKKAINPSGESNGNKRV